MIYHFAADNRAIQSLARVTSGRSTTEAIGIATDDRTNRTIAMYWEDQAGFNFVALNEIGRQKEVAIRSAAT